MAYFDGPGGTQVPTTVVDAISTYLLQHNANTHWHFPSSVETDRVIADARSTMATFLNAAGPNEVSFGQNMTTITFHLARALARNWSAGDEIVVTELDHHANIAPWHHAARDHQLTVRCAPLDQARTGLDLDALAQLVGPRTRLVAVGAASNAIGTITDIAAIARRAHQVGALVFVDAVHYAPHVLPDVQRLECDFLACSAYKFYGPHLGVLWGRHALLQRLDLPRLDPAPATAPDSLETGTQSHEAIAGAAAAVRFLAGDASASGEGLREALVTRFALFHQHALALTRRLWSGLQGIPDVTLYGPSLDEPRTPTVSFALAGSSSHDVSRHLADAGIFASSGDFYATTLVERLGVGEGGLLRAGCACYTTEREVDRLVEAVAALR